MPEERTVREITDEIRECGKVLTDLGIGECFDVGEPIHCRMEDGDFAIFELTGGEILVYPTMAVALPYLHLRTAERNGCGTARKDFLESVLTPFIAPLEGSEAFGFRRLRPESGRPPDLSRGELETIARAMKAVAEVMRRLRRDGAYFTLQYDDPGEMPLEPDGALEMVAVTSADGTEYEYLVRVPADGGKPAFAWLGMADSASGDSLEAVPFGRQDFFGKESVRVSVRDLVLFSMLEETGKIGRTEVTPVIYPERRIPALDGAADELKEILQKTVDMCAALGPDADEIVPGASKAFPDPAAFVRAPFFAGEVAYEVLENPLYRHVETDDLVCMAFKETLARFVRLFGAA